MDQRLKPKAIISTHIKAAIVSVTGGILISLLLAFPIKFLWNWLMPGLFDFPVISAIEAWGLTFLARMVFPTVVSLSNDKTKTN